jgi:hypothetical protein
LPPLGICLLGWLQLPLLPSTSYLPAGRHYILNLWEILVKLSTVISLGFSGDYECTICMLFTLTWVNYTSPAIKSRVRVWGAYQSTCKNANLPSSTVLDLACVKYNTSHQNVVCARLSFQEHQTVKMSFPYSGVDYVLVLCQIWGSLSGVAKHSSLLWCKAVSFGVYCSGPCSLNMS